MRPDGAASAAGSDGASDVDRAPSLAAGAQFGRYKITRLIGSGGMGAVYEATHLDLKKRVAIKILHPSFAGNQDVQKRFLREGESTSRIHHPHVVDVTDFGIHDGTPFLVMEFLQGESLAARLSRDGRMDVAELCDLMIPVCAALGAAHQAAVIHRDLKPENIFLARPSGAAANNARAVHPKVVDFGVSKVLETTDAPAGNLTMTSGLVGSPAYMSPEQVRSSRTLDARSDQYALGVVLYECATGTKPFRADNLFALMGQIVQGQFDPPRVVRPDLPQAFEDVVVRALQREPDARFPDVHAMARALLPLATERARIVWGHAFDDDDDDGGEAGAGRVSRLDIASATAAATARHAAGHIAPAGETVAARPGALTPSPAPAGATPPTPAPVQSPREGGTLAESAREIDSPSKSGAPSRGLGRGARLGLLGALAFTLVVGVGWRLSHTSASGASAAPATSTPATTSAAATTTASTPSAPPATYIARVRVEPTGAALELDGAPAGTDALLRELPRDGAVHTLIVRAPGHAPQTVTFRDAPPPERITLAPLAALPHEEPAATSAGATSAEPPSSATRNARRTDGTTGARRNGAAGRTREGTGGNSGGTSVGINGAAIVE